MHITQREMEALLIFAILAQLQTFDLFSQYRVSLQKRGGSKTHISLSGPLVEFWTIKFLSKWHKSHH